MKMVHVINLGCWENHLEGAQIAAFFRENGWKVTRTPGSADLVVVNSCGLRKQDEERTTAIYRHLKQTAKKGSRIVMAGCLPAINRDLIRAMGYEDVVVTPRTLRRLDDVIDAAIPIESVKVLGLDDPQSYSKGAKGGLLRNARRLAAILGTVPLLPVPRWLWQALYLPLGDAVHIRASIGCMGKCSYCPVPKAKGRTSSFARQEVIGSILKALKCGAKVITLCADDLGSYGQDLGTDVGQLLQEAVALPADYRLILRNVEPEWLIKCWNKLESVFRSGKIAYVVIPLQSGSKRILELMRRTYSPDEYRVLIRRIRQISPKTILRTHVMVGFPGETHEDFMCTYRLLRDLPIDHFCVFEYSARPHTPAAQLSEKVPAETMHYRSRRLRLLQVCLYAKPSRWLPLRP